MTPPHARWLAGLAALSIGLAANADALLVVRTTGHAVDVVEPGTGSRLMSVDVGSTPYELAVAPDGRHAVVTLEGTEVGPGHSLSLLDLEQPRELARIDLGRHNRPHGVHWYAPDRVAVTTEDSGQLLLIDPLARRVVAELPIGRRTSPFVVVTPDGERAFVSDDEAGTTTVVDLASGRKLRDLATGAGTEGLALSRDGGELWVASREADRVSVIDAQTLETRAALALAGDPTRIAFTGDGRTALVGCAGSGEVVAIDARSRFIVARRTVEATHVALPQRPAAVRQLAIVTGGQSAWVSVTDAETIVKLALPGLAVVQTLPAPGGPRGLGFTTLLPKFECHACGPADD